jgi:Xaa-Pro aminopeptidase
MALSIDAVQRALKEDGIDGWLLYDFHGSNPIANRVAGLASSSKLATRRWYYLIPAQGAPRGLVHAIERHNLDGLPGEKRAYAGREQLATGLRDLLGGMKRVAMEYSPRNAIPYVSRVDAGTVEAVRESGAEVVSSGDLVQRFEAVWTDEAYKTHVAASDRLYRIKDRTFQLIRDRLASGTAMNEFEVQRAMLGWFDTEGLYTDSPPIVAAQENAGDPHYGPARDASRAIGPNEIVLLDLWGKLPQAGAVFADITWVGFTGPVVPAEFASAFAAAAAGRDAAVDLVQSAVRQGRELRGFEVDRTCRDVIEKAGYGAQFIHRTGHSLGEDVHGNGVHMDDYETHDDRRLIAGTGFTIEPGVYTDRFGVRTEINMFVAEREARVTGALQQAIVPLA